MNIVYTNYNIAKIINKDIISLLFLIRWCYEQLNISYYACKLRCYLKLLLNLIVFLYLLFSLLIIGCILDYYLMHLLNFYFYDLVFSIWFDFTVCCVNNIILINNLYYILLIN